MPEYPPNSYTSKTPKKEPEDKKIEKVVVGSVSRRRPSLGARFKQTFMGDDAQSVGKYILMDVVIPAVRDLIADVGIQSIERTLYGESRSGARRSAISRMAGSAYTQYHRVSQQQKERPDPRAVPGRPQVREYPSWEDIVLDTRAEADAAIDQLRDLIGRYEQASVTELYEIVGLKSEYTDNLWGWQDIHGMGVRYVRGGYLLVLPQPVVLKEA